MLKILAGQVYLGTKPLLPSPVLQFSVKSRQTEGRSGLEVTVFRYIKQRSPDRLLSYRLFVHH